jgi:aminocarboxymuconate-semialdehyde decarboxylase
MIIDMHAHFFPDISEKLSNSIINNNKAPWLRIDNINYGMIMKGKKEFRPVTSSLWNSSHRLLYMDHNHIDIQIISATPLLFSYDIEIIKAKEWCMRINDYARELCSINPHRLKSLCQVPLQDIKEACREASRAKKSGHIGVQIGTNINGKNLSDCIEFLNYCAEINFPILVHPWNIMSSERMKPYMLEWLVGMPAETHLALLSLILSNSFEKLPKNLKICFAHSGGNFIWQLGRVDNAWHKRDLVRLDSEYPPSHYIDRFYVDSLIFNVDAMKLLIKKMTINKILIGTDYPFPLGDLNPKKIIDDLDHISLKEKNMIFSENTKLFFNL